MSSRPPRIAFPALLFYCSTPLECVHAGPVCSGPGRAREVPVEWPALRRRHKRARQRPQARQRRAAAPPAALQKRGHQANKCRAPAGPRPMSTRSQRLIYVVCSAPPLRRAVCQTRGFARTGCSNRACACREGSACGATGEAARTCVGAPCIESLESAA